MTITKRGKKKRVEEDGNIGIPSENNRIKERANGSSLVRRNDLGKWNLTNQLVFNKREDYEKRAEVGKLSTEIQEIIC